MGFTSIEFIFALPLAIFLYYVIPSKARPIFLLILNILFISTVGVWSLASVLVLALVTYLFGMGVESSARFQKPILITGILLLLAPLIALRVNNMFETSIIAPLGISFYTLEAISYLADVHSGKIKAEKNPLRIVIWLSFFFNITSGPIYRYDEFSDTHSKISELKADYSRIISGIFYLVWGLFLKLVIADRLATPVNKVFNEFETTNYSGIILIAFAFAYSIQIYTDFAGYSCMAIGIAIMLGYNLPENFNAPYFSNGIKEFWGRWHISFSRWLKDYIYIPLGGNRKGTLRKYINVLTTFIVSGLWHGFRGHFVAWGMLHALYQIVGDKTKGFKKNSPVVKGIGILITFILTTFAWIFFKIGTVHAIRYIKGMFSIQGALFGGLDLGIERPDMVVLGIALLIMFILELVSTMKKANIIEYIIAKPTLVRCVFIIAIVLIMLIFGIYGNQHDAGYFIYRDF